MSRQGISTDIRRLLLQGNVFGLAIAVLVGTTLFRLLYATIEYLVIPLARGIFDKRAHPEAGYFNAPPYFTFNGYSLVWGEVLTFVIILSLAALLVIVLKKRIAFDDEGEYDDDAGFEEGSDFRTCPECLSLIPAVARRCAYCTAPVEPLAQEGQE